MGVRLRDRVEVVVAVEVEEHEGSQGRWRRRVLCRSSGAALSARLIPFILLASYILGLLAADRLVLSPMLPLLLIGGCFLVALSGALFEGVIRDALPVADRGDGLRESGFGCRRGPSRRLALALASLAVFSFASERLSARFERAERDRALAWNAAEVGPSGVRIVEALVAGRKPLSWGDEVVLSPVQAVDGLGEVPRRLLLRVESGGQEGRRASVAELEEGGSDPGRFDSPGVLRAEMLLERGQRVRLGLRIAPLLGTRNPGQIDAAHSASRRGVGAVARLIGPGWVLGHSRENEPWRESFSRRASRSRDHIRRSIVERFSGTTDRVGLAAALSVGQRSELSEETRLALRAMGISHLIAISGLHVGLVGGFAVIFARRMLGVYSAGASVVRGPGYFARPSLRLDPFLGALACGAIAAAAYGWLSGAAPAVTRAALIFLVLVLSRAMGRRLSSAAGLAWIALGLILVEPALLFDVGAQLSFAACAGLICAGFGESRQEKRATGFRERVEDSLRLSLAASFATAPFIGAIGGVLASWGPVINLIAIPWTAFVVLPSSFLAALVASLPQRAGLDVLLALVLWPAGLSESAAIDLAAWLPSAELPVILGPTGVGVIAALGLYLLRRKRGAAAYLLWVVLAAGSVAPPLASFTGAKAPDAPRVVSFDVGQGDATLVEGTQARILIDAGGGVPGRSNGGTVMRALRALGVSELDAVVVTHGDYDHRGGASAVLQHFKVKELWLPRGAESDPPLRALESEARQCGTRVRWMHSSPDRIELGELSIDVLWPPPPELSDTSGSREDSTTSADARRGDLKEARPVFRRSDRNDGSLVLRIRLDGIVYLFAADIGTRVEAALVRRHQSNSILESDVLKVGHHGSARSSSRDFLAAVSPQIAIVSAPCRATRGLPHAEALGRIVAQDVELAWTGRDGAVFVSRGTDALPTWLGWGQARPCEGPRLTPDEARRPLLDESTLGFSGILGLAQGAAERFLLGIGVLKIHPLERTNAGECGLDCEGRIRGDLVGGFEGAGQEILGGDDFIEEPNGQGFFGVDRLSGIEKVRGMDRSDLSRQRDRGLSRWIESERNLLERKSRMGHREANLAGQHQVESPGPSMSVDGSDQRNAELGLDQRGVANRAHSLKVDGVDLFASREGLGYGNGLFHIHSAAEDAIAGSGQDRDPNISVFVDPLPRGRQVSQGFGVE